VRGWLPWLLVFGVIAGLWGRVLAVDHVHFESKGQKHAHECCGHHHHDDGDDQAPADDSSDSSGDQHGPDCPPYPHEHHTHSCCHNAPLTGADLASPGLLTLAVSRTAVDWQRVTRPDEPVFALDKPPLI
jgi:hypothetical protein